MRVVLDTNVLLSALLSPHGLSDVIYRAWQKDRFDLVTSATQIDELRRASRYAKFKDMLQPHRVGTMVNNMRRSIMLDAQPPLPEGIEVSDPNDAFLLAMALTGEAVYLDLAKRWAKGTAILFAVGAVSGTVLSLELGLGCGCRVLRQYFAGKDI